MSGVLILLTISAVINILLAKVLMLKHEEMLQIKGMYRAEARRCARLEHESKLYREKCEVESMQ